MLVWIALLLLNRSIPKGAEVRPERPEALPCIALPCMALPYISPYHACPCHAWDLSMRVFAMHVPCHGPWDPSRLSRLGPRARLRVLLLFLLFLLFLVLLLFLLIVPESERRRDGVTVRHATIGGRRRGEEGAPPLPLQPPSEREQDIPTRHRLPRGAARRRSRLATTAVTDHGLTRRDAYRDTRRRRHRCYAAPTSSLARARRWGRGRYHQPTNLTARILALV